MKTCEFGFTCGERCCHVSEVLTPRFSPRLSFISVPSNSPSPQCQRSRAIQNAIHLFTSSQHRTQIFIYILIYIYAISHRLPPPPSINTFITRKQQVSYSSLLSGLSLKILTLFRRSIRKQWQLRIRLSELPAIPVVMLLSRWKGQLSRTFLVILLRHWLTNAAGLLMNWSRSTLGPKSTIRHTQGSRMPVLSRTQSRFQQQLHRGLEPTL